VNNLLYKIGDIVCLKERVSSPLGEYHCSSFEAIPMTVVNVMPDVMASNRIGVLGDNHSYECVPITRFPNKIQQGVRFKRYQYELTLWNNRKEAILKDIKEYTSHLENIC